MFASNKSQTHPEMDVSELLALNKALDDLIFRWVKIEVGAGIRPNSKLSEINLFNFKIIFSGNEKATALRSYLARTVDLKEDTDYTFSRIHDLYLTITMLFPTYYIESIRKRHRDTLENMGYDVDDEHYDRQEYAWLFHKIQHIIRYELTQIKLNS